LAFQIILISHITLKSILEKIATGQMGKFYSKICLLDQSYYRENKRKVSDVLKEKNPGAKVKAFELFMVGEQC